MKLVPTPSQASAPFWDATRKQRFLLQRDRRSGCCQFPPRPLGLSGPSEVEWIKAKGTGVLVAATVCHVPGSGFEEEAPYLVGLVKLDEGPRVFARIVNAGRDGVRVGQPVRLVWQDGGHPYAFAPAPDI